jgi:phage-related protein (TIGR01555 family)
MGIRHTFDGFLNFISGLGTIKDPTTGMQYNYVELNRNDVEQAYRSNWIARTVVNAPAEDATKEWRSWQASQKQIEAIEEVEKLHGVQKKMRQALTRARLYGGAALVIGVEQGNIDEPLDLDAVGEGDLKWVVVMNRYELNAGPRIYDVESPWYTRPEYYMVATPTVNVDNRYPGEVSGTARMHPSRVIEFVGNELPDWRLAPLGGTWGDSVLQTLDETLKDFGISLGGIANMINDAKMDVIKIPEFSKKIADDKYAGNLLKRFSTANMMKSNINSLIMDKEEEWERVQTTFSGLPQVLQVLMPIVSAAGGIPVSRLMGQAPGKGLSQATSGGESDLYNYYDGIASKQKTEYSPAMTPLDQVIIRSALGSYDPAVYYDWTPLYTPDHKEVAAIALQKMQTTQGYVNMGLVNEDVMRAIVLNQWTEDSTYPGLDDAVDEFGAEPDEPEVGPEDVQNHLNMLQQSSQQLRQLTGPNGGNDDQQQLTQDGKKKRRVPSARSGGPLFLAAPRGDDEEEDEDSVEDALPPWNDIRNIDGRT